MNFDKNYTETILLLISLFIFSDIDLVVVGLWESLPLRTLERRLLERNIADPATIKVIIIMNSFYLATEEKLSRY